jgi:peptidoglycan/LPS O-acetylase OafA/YrhL
MSEAARVSSRDEIPELTSIRGIAAWAVVLHHFREFGGGHLPTFAQFICDHGYLAVDLFFVMSGYIMMHVHGTDFARIGRVATTNFFSRRFARIYPLHLLVLLAYLAVTIVTQLRHPSELSSRFSAGSFGVQLVLGQAFTGNWGLYTWNVPSWSLSVEMVAYLLMPLIGWLILRSSVRVLAASTVVLIVLLPMVLYSRGVPDLNRAISEAILRGVCQFALGCVLYSLHRSHRCNIPWILSLPVGGFVLTYAIIGQAALLLSLPTVIFAIITIVSQREHLPAVSGFLRLPMLMTLGQWSFSTYMVHYFVRDLAKSLAAPMWTVPLWFMLILILSAVAYRFYEVPARRFLTARFIKTSSKVAAV